MALAGGGYAADNCQLLDSLVEPSLVGAAEPEVAKGTGLAAWWARLEEGGAGTFGTAVPDIALHRMTSES